MMGLIGGCWVEINNQHPMVDDVPIAFLLCIPLLSSVLRIGEKVSGFTIEVQGY